jgi:hypothetical protein
MEGGLLEEYHRDGEHSSSSPLLKQGQLLRGAPPDSFRDPLLQPSNRGYLAGGRYNDVEIDPFA